MKKIIALIVIIIFSSISNSSASGEIILENSERFEINSKVNKIKYTIDISLPRNYQHTQKKYPVIYLLDKEYSFLITRSIFQHFSERGDIDDAILVGIGYDKTDEDDYFLEKNKQLPSYKKNRSRDYVPIKAYETKGGSKKDAEYNDEMGGSSKFRKFIKTELWNKIKERYRVNGEKTIVGHSYGGLFVVWSYLIDGEAFNNYIAISPSIWFKENWVLSKVRPKRINKKASLYLSYGTSESERMKNGVNKLESLLLKSGNITKGNLKVERIANENHSSVFPSSITHALLFSHKTNN